MRQPRHLHDPLGVASRIVELERELGIGQPDKLWERIQWVCQDAYVARLADVVAIELTLKNLDRLEEELASRVWLQRLCLTSTEMEGALIAPRRIAQIANQTTGTLMDLRPGTEDRILVRYPTRVAWMDRRHTARRSHKRAQWVDEWEGLPFVPT